MRTSGYSPPGAIWVTEYGFIDDSRPGSRGTRTTILIRNWKGYAPMLGINWWYWENYWGRINADGPK